MNKKYIIITVICTALSIISGILTKDLIIGGTTLIINRTTMCIFCK